MSVQQAAKVIAATLIEAILILGFLGVSLGLGGGGHVRIGPDRPPQLVMPARALPPDLEGIPR